MKTFFLFLFLFLGISLPMKIFAQIEMVDLSDRIAMQRLYLDSYSALFELKEYSLEDRFIAMVQELKTDKKNQTYKFIKGVDSFFPPKILMPLVYWKIIKGDKEKVEKVLTYYFFYRLMVLRDTIDSPLSSSAERENTLSVLREISENSEITANNIYKKSYQMVATKVKALTSASDEDFASMVEKEKLLSLNFSELSDAVGDHSISALGFIPGNKVELISENDRSMERIKWLNERVIFNGGVFDMNLPYIKMPTPKDPSGHIAFQKDPIFIKIRDMIAEAKDSIFIDIFLFGGTLGATLAEYLVEQTILKYRANPNFKVLLLHDYATNYNMKPEMMPIFEYLRDGIKRVPELKASMMLMQANIQRHPPGIPFGLTNMIPKTPETFKLMEKRNTYYESKIDHSKVVVIDANSDHPKAYFGSKNWSDHSGAYYYDDAIYVEGPGAAMVQASYYDDLDAALTLDKTERSWFFFKEEGFGNDNYLANRDSILNWFKIKRCNYPAVGDQSIRLAEGNVDGRIKNARNIFIDMIASAQDHIYMEELFIYDKYIIDALIKRKIQNPSLDIKIIADHNGNFGMNGLPNTIFMNDLIKYDISLRARRTIGVTATFPNGKTQEYHQENHRKICSVDGKVLLGGSSNLNPDTLQGSFREFGAQLFDQQVISKFERNFLTDWNDSSKVEAIDVENIQLKIGSKLFSKETSVIINGVLSHILRSKDDLEERH